MVLKQNHCQYFGQNFFKRKPFELIQVSQNSHFKYLQLYFKQYFFNFKIRIPKTYLKVIIEKQSQQIFPSEPVGLFLDRQRKYELGTDLCWTGRAFLDRQRKYELGTDLCWTGQAFLGSVEHFFQPVEQFSESIEACQTLTFKHPSLHVSLVLSR